MQRSAGASISWLMYMSERQSLIITESGCGEDSRGTKGGAGTNRRGDWQSGASGARTRARPGPAAKLDGRDHAEAARQAAGEQEQSGGSGEKFRGGGWAVGTIPGE